MGKWQFWGSVQLAVALGLAGGLPIAAQENPENMNGGMGNIVDEQLPPPALTVTDWLAQIEASLVQITGVRVEETEAGLQIMLDTIEGRELDTPQTRIVGNALIAEIPNAVLELPDADQFQVAEPAPGIAFVSVTALGPDRVQIAITGMDAPPVAEVTATGLTVTLGEAIAGDDDEAIQVVVTGQQQDEGYFVPDASVGTRTDTPILDTPQSIQVVPGEVTRDQRTNTLIEALQNVPGVSQGGQSTRGLFNVFSIRGFDASNNILRDGTLDTNTRVIGYDPSWVEQIEVLRGPASVLFGSGSLGGTINLVSKKPLEQPFYELEASIGNYDYYRGSLDVTGPLTPDAKVLGRLNIAVDSNGTFVDFFDTRRYVVTPRLTWKINDKANLSLDGQYLYLDKPFDTGLPAKGTVFSNPNGKIPRSRFLGDFESSDNSSVYRIGLDFDYQFSDDWQLRSVFSASFLNLDRLQYATQVLQTDDRTMTRAFAPQRFDDDSYNFDTYFTGKFSTGNVKHKLVTGINLYRLDTFTVVSIGTASPIDVFNPVYNQPLGSATPFADASSTVKVLGLYVQDEINFSDKVILLLGGRFDIADFSQTDRLNQTSGSEHYNSFSPRVGIVYKPIPPISIYGSYAKSFNVTANFSSSNPSTEPEFGTQYEVGIKGEINDRLLATLAFYDLTRTNIPTTDPNNPALSILVGEQNSKGFDFNLTGEILPGWNLILGYALTDARVSQDNTFEEGNFINNVPLHSFNLWSTYEIQEGSVKGLGFGLGLFYVGQREGDLANSFQIPGYFRTDASIFYNRDKFRAALNIRNLFDINYFEAATSINRVFPGAPFTIIGSLSWQF